MIENWLNEGESQAEIAKRLNQHLSTSLRASKKRERSKRRMKISIEYFESIFRFGTVILSKFQFIYIKAITASVFLLLQILYSQCD
ncbi:helix-turn-helix domain-containing protein [Dolosigranulum pigrum]|nr:helix-turn-helix domain-containing protein [Dolosigranulum pigrum]QTJ54195.1 helix-turn-helix domain-containing protein [Dolosigranulum pigrum]